MVERCGVVGRLFGLRCSGGGCRVGSFDSKDAFSDHPKDGAHRHGREGCGESWGELNFGACEIKGAREKNETEVEEVVDGKRYASGSLLWGVLQKRLHGNGEKRAGESENRNQYDARRISLGSPRGDADGKACLANEHGHGAKGDQFPWANGLCHDRHANASDDDGGCQRYEQQ